MLYFNKISNLQDYVLSNAAEYFELVIYAGISFFLPLLLGHPQIVVGVMVNAMLITSALNLKGYKLWPVILLPSLGVLSRGMIFGPFTIFLAYMIPFIWIGNAILVYCFKIMKLYMKKNYAVTLIAGSLLKAGFLFGSAYVLFSLGIIPAVFLTSMGAMQLWTALGGGAAAAGIHYTKKRILSR